MGFLNKLSNQQALDQASSGRQPQYQPINNGLALNSPKYAQPGINLMMGQGAHSFGGNNFNESSNQ
jgi:hypothetical protein|tara:strand:+ start:452 stop:649 length:198 start_codon:yes stop_codon:yes gene_type:complete